MCLRGGSPPLVPPSRPPMIVAHTRSLRGGHTGEKILRAAWTIYYWATTFMQGAQAESHGNDCSSLLPRKNYVGLRKRRKIFLCLFRRCGVRYWHEKTSSPPPSPTSRPRMNFEFSFLPPSLRASARQFDDPGRGTTPKDKRKLACIPFLPNQRTIAQPIMQQNSVEKHS